MRGWGQWEGSPANNTNSEGAGSVGGVSGRGHLPTTQTVRGKGGGGRAGGRRERDPTPENLEHLIYPLQIVLTL